MSIQERLGGLGRIGLDEAAVAVGQVQDEVVGFLLHPADDHQCLAEVALGMARRVGERHEHLPRLAAMLSYVVFDRGVPTVEPVLVPQPLEDSLRGVALLLGGAVILFQDLVDDAGIGLQLGSAGRSLPPVPGGTGYSSILRTVSRCSPNVRAASRMLIPSTITAQRTRRYMSTVYIRCTIHRLDSNPMDGGGRFDLQPPNVSDCPHTWPNISPPLTVD